MKHINETAEYIQEANRSSIKCPRCKCAAPEYAPQQRQCVSCHFSFSVGEKGEVPPKITNV